MITTPSIPDAWRGTASLLLACIAVSFALLGCSDRTRVGERVATETQAITPIVRTAKTIMGSWNGGPVPLPPNHWENISLAVPPNRAGCGPSGAVFFRPAGAQGSPADGYGWKQVWKTSLSCLRGTASQCTATISILGNSATDTTYRGDVYLRGNPVRQQIVYPGGNDSRMVRLTDDTLLLQAQATAVTAGGFEPHSVQAFYASTDCGQTWSLRSVIDGKYDFANGTYHDPASISGGLDFPFLHVDPWRGTVYFLGGGFGWDTSGGTVTERRDAVLLVSKDNARTWSFVSDPATGLSPIPMFRQALTTLPSGEAVIFGCEYLIPTFRIYNPSTNLLSFAGTAGQACEFFTSAQVGGAAAPLRSNTPGIARVLGADQVVRTMVPSIQNNRQRIALTDVIISGGAVGGAFPTTYITPTSANGSATHPTITDADYLDFSKNGTTNPSLVYWLETNQTNPLWGTTAQPKFQAFTGGGAPGTLGTSFDRLVEQGDYLGGSFYYDSATQQAGFVSLWMPDTLAESPFLPLDTLRASVVEWSEPTLTNCPTPDGTTPNRCTANCPCVEGQADCATGGCATGLTCGTDLGPNFGLASNIDVCVPSACNPNPNSPGSSDFCSTTCRCTKGKGDCDSDAQCLPGLVCGRNNGAGFLLGASYDVCVPSHCTDWVRNGDETSVDRGPSCGTPTCPLAGGMVGASCKGALNQGNCDVDSDCVDPSLTCSGGICSCRTSEANGGPRYCSSLCKCAQGSGLCKTNNDCMTGLVCAGGAVTDDIGGLYGLVSRLRDPNTVQDNVILKDMKVCLPSTCATQRATPGPMTTPGHADFCTTTCPCARGFGHCANNSECLSGLVCAAGLGPNFGLSVETKVCVPSHCTNGFPDGDESDTDCGGRDCGSCDQPISRWVGTVPQPRPLTMFRRTTGVWLEGTWTGVGGAARQSAADRYTSALAYADVNGDLVHDRVAYRDGVGNIYALGDSTFFSTSTAPDGHYGDVPTIGKYNAGATADIGWWKKSNSTWYAYETQLGTNALPFPSGVFWGQSGDIPVPGDYDGDGRYDYAIFRPSTGEWHVKNTDGASLWVNGSVPQIWGGANDIPVAGDYIGDSRSDLAYYRPALQGGKGSFHILWKDGTTVTPAEVTEFGAFMDVPVGGDMNQDGKSDICIFRPNRAQWLCQNVAGTWSGTRVWGEPRPRWPPQ